MNQLVSVIVPVYKVEHYLRRCVDSVIRQTFENLEIILVDDGSPDCCGAICDEYAVQDSRVTVIHQANTGLSGARNAGIAIARGDYLAFVDSDDFIAEDFVECLLHACESTGSDLSQCRWEYVTGSKIREKSAMPGDITLFTGREMLANLYIPDGAYFVVAWNKLYKRKLFLNIRYPVGRVHEDEATTYKIYDLAAQAAVVDRALYGYFTSDESITRNKFSRSRLDWIWAIAGRLDFFEEKELDELIPGALKAFADGCIDLYYKCSDFIPDSTEDLRQIISCVYSVRKRVKRFGQFPVRTRFGYWLFCMAPSLYRWVLEGGKKF